MTNLRKTCCRTLLRLFPCPPRARSGVPPKTLPRCLLSVVLYACERNQREQQHHHLQLRRSVRVPVQRRRWVGAVHKVQDRRRILSASGGYAGKFFYVCSGMTRWYLVASHAGISKHTRKTHLQAQKTQQPRKAPSWCLCKTHESYSLRVGYACVNRNMFLFYTPAIVIKNENRTAVDGLTG